MKELIQRMSSFKYPHFNGTFCFCFCNAASRVSSWNCLCCLSFFSLSSCPSSSWIFWRALVGRPSFHSSKAQLILLFFLIIIQTFVNKLKRITRCWSYYSKNKQKKPTKLKPQRLTHLRIKFENFIFQKITKYNIYLLHPLKGRWKRLWSMWYACLASPCFLFLFLVFDFLYD